MSFLVRSIQTHIVTHALRADRIIATHYGRHDASVFLQVTARGDDDLTGVGEAAVTAPWSGETAETAQIVIRTLFAPRIEGAHFDHPREALALMDRAAWGNPFAKAAVETALWDLWARGRNVPATELFADRPMPESIPTRASIGTYPPGETVRLAREFWREGVRTLKFKIGTPGIDDVARLRAVREALGSDPIFTLDANGAYPGAREAIEAVEALLPFSPVLLEQPTPRERLSLLAEVRRRVPLPIMADEAVFTPNDLGEALDLDAFDVLSLYPGKNGGFSRSIDMAAIARSAGKRCTIGSNLESEIGQAAMVCLAAGLTAFPVEEIAGDFQAALMYESSSLVVPMGFTDGRVGVPRGHGFGVTPRPSIHEFERCGTS